MDVDRKGKVLWEHLEGSTSEDLGIREGFPAEVPWKLS